jgi:hypothetical protein
MMGGGAIGVPELMIVLVIGLFWAAPIAAAVWVVVTLRRIRAGQQAVQVKLDTIERLLQRS